jgi:hypothetical protein
VPSYHVSSKRDIENTAAFIEIVWQGEVEVLDIRGHPKAKRAYAWGHATGENDQAPRYVAVLELPPVDSPETAVKVAVAAEIKNARQNTKGR